MNRTNSEERDEASSPVAGLPAQPVTPTEMPTRFTPLHQDRSQHSPGDQISARYEILQRVGGGGMGMVYQAIDRELNRTVAIKRIRPELLAKSDVLQRFDHEAQAIATLNHPNIVQIFDRGSDAAGPYLVMEYVGGPSLDQRLASGQPLELDETVQIITAMCDALQAAHERGILHRDVKPANILFTSDGIPKLTDFGLARLETHSGVTQAGVVFGTPFYLAPEQQLDANLTTPRSDQFSLAATMYHLLTGEVPRRILERRLPEMLRDLVLRGTEHDPAARYPTMLHMKEALTLAWSKPSSNRFVDENLSSNAFETLKRQREKVRQSHELARRLAYEQHDWGQALAILSPLPADVREEPMYSEIKRNADIVEGLSASVARACRDIEWYGLNVPAEILAQLQPHRGEFREIAEQLDPKFRVDRTSLSYADSGALQRLQQLHPTLSKVPEIEQVALQSQARDQESTRLQALAAEVREICKRPIHKCSYHCLDSLARHLREDPSPNLAAARKYQEISTLLIECVIDLYDKPRPLLLIQTKAGFSCPRRIFLIKLSASELRVDHILPAEFCEENQEGRFGELAFELYLYVGIMLLVFGVGLPILIFYFNAKKKVEAMRTRLKQRYPITPGLRPNEAELAQIRWWTWVD
jgi:serine/threonine protein kinase